MNNLKSNKRINIYTTVLEENANTKIKSSLSKQLINLQKLMSKYKNKYKGEYLCQDTELNHVWVMFVKETVLKEELLIIEDIVRNAAYMNQELN
jgi:hypothetical protein|nr:MAG TPA: hypothetical protein [Caudoviricetes sp.]